MPYGHCPDTVNCLGEKLGVRLLLEYFARTFRLNKSEELPELISSNSHCVYECVNAKSCQYLCASSIRGFLWLNSSWRNLD